MKKVVSRLSQFLYKIKDASALKKDTSTATLESILQDALTAKTNLEELNTFIINSIDGSETIMLKFKMHKKECIWSLLRLIGINPLIRMSRSLTLLIMVTEKLNLLIYHPKLTSMITLNSFLSPNWKRLKKDCKHQTVRSLELP
jgi:hypothetical protein